MPRSKKRKTAHHNSTIRDGDLSHAEIWDDSALIRSWNDALAEYEFYHSIHANGEDVEEILRQAEAAEEAESATRKIAETDNMNGKIETFNSKDTDVDDDAEDGEIDESEDITTLDQGSSNDNRVTTTMNNIPETKGPLNATNSAVSVTQDKPRPNYPHSVDENSSQHTTAKPTDLPDQVGTTSTDQTLENIKMAYYWAGYYSGLHDGQKQAQAQAQAQNQIPAETHGQGQQ